jgi:hypothetical protein
MLKPVSILALDDASSTLGEAVQRRIASLCGLEDLVQCRPLGGDVAQAVSSIHAQRQSPGNPLRARDDISTRELVLLIVSAAGPARTKALEIARDVRRLYEMRRLAEFYTLEILCLLPDLFTASTAAEYGAAYALLKMASACDPKPFDAFWLLDSTNANRVRFGHLEQANDTYAEAVAGALMYEPELSGALQGAFRPRGVDATFSSFGYAELFFPRDAALQRLEPRLAAALVREKLLTGGAALQAALAAKQFVVGEEFAGPLLRIGVEAGQSLFNRFQPKTFVNERTRSADEVIAAVRNELKVHRDTTHVANLQALATQGEQTAADVGALLVRVVDERLDRDGYSSATAFLEALLESSPGLRADADVAPRNLVTEIQTATAALDARLRFTPNTAASDASRRRIRELDNLLADQQLVADVHSPANSAEQLDTIQREKDELTRQLPDVIYFEESENNFARNAARDGEAARLAEETLGKEQQLRELFAQKPRAGQALAEALEARRTFLWRQLWWTVAGVAAMYGVPFAFDLLFPNIGAIHRLVAVGMSVFAVVTIFRYSTTIAPLIRAARENLLRIQEQITVVDRARNSAHNDELQFEYDVAHRRATLSVLRRTRELAKNTLDALRVRFTELEELAGSFTPSSIASHPLAISIVDDGDVDAWYERTADDRKPLFREFPIARSQSRHLPVDELRWRIAAYAATAFDAFRKLTIAEAVHLTSPLTQRLKRFSEYTAPLIELRGDDLQAQQAMQRDTTMWIDSADPAFVSSIQRRLPDAHTRPATDPLRIHALSRVLHYPAYTLGQFEYYRAQYDPALFPESASAPDLQPAELILTGAVRTAYEQVLLGRAVGVINLRDGQLHRASTNLVLGDSHLAAAQHLASSEGAMLLREVEEEIAPKLSTALNVERDLRQLALIARSPLDEDVLERLLRRYSAVF